jgi:endonuclease YncB( thermonuclease family)
MTSGIAAGLCGGDNIQPHALPAHHHPVARRDNRRGADRRLSGQARIIDGDTLEIHGTRIRLWGIDAPESSQLCRGEDSEQYRCGAKAANDLDAFIARRPVSCIPISLDQYGRTVAILYGGRC